MMGRSTPCSMESLQHENDALTRENESLREQLARLEARQENQGSIEKALHESEERLRLSLEATQDGVWDWDIAADSGSFTSHCYTMLGYQHNEFSAAFNSWAQITHTDDCDALMLSFHRHLATGEKFAGEVRMKHKSGEWHWILTRGKVIKRDREGKPLRMIGTFTDIHERKKAEEELRKYREHLEELVAQRTAELESANQVLKDAEHRYRTVADFTYDWESWESRENSYLYVSPSCEHITGHTAEEFLGNPRLMSTLILPEDRKIWAHHQKATHAHREMQEIQFRITRRDGEIRWIEHVCRPVLDSQGNFSGVRSSNRDITGRKHTEEQLHASLSEKEVLLREIHHRVKNNLSMVASLLALQAGKFKDPLLKEALKESQNRVRSIALIHEKLYQAGTIAKLDFVLYIKSIVAILFKSYAREGITFTISSGSIYLPPNTAIPLALVTNELVSNALKYAFPGEGQGVVDIDIAAAGTGSVVMTIRDDGIGLPKDLDFRKPPSLGLELVTMLVSQISGTLQMSRDKGTTFTITFDMAG